MVQVLTNSTSTPSTRLSGPLHSVQTELGRFKQSTGMVTLAQHVKELLTAAVAHRRNIGIDTELDRSYHASVSKYTADEKVHLPKNVDVYMGITENKCRAFVSWVADILSSAEDRPWTLRPTPLPDLPEALKQAVASILENEIQQFGTGFDIEKRLSELKGFAQKHADDRANKAAALHEKKINDQLEDGGWRLAFDEFIQDMSWAPTAFIKAPVLRYRKKLQWNDGTMFETLAPCLCVERIDPTSIYPSPDSQDTQNGAYIFEVKKMMPHQLKEATLVEGFHAPAIEKVLADNTGGYNDWISRANKVETGGVTTKDPEDKAPSFDVAVLYGKLPGRMLIEYGLPVDFQNFYEAEVWLIDDMIIRAILNPHPLGRRPIEGTSFAPKPGAFWGRSLPMILRDIQRVANAAARALVVNMGFSSGPITEYEADRLVNEERIEDIHPYRVYAVESDPSGGGHSAFRFNNVPSYAPEFNAVFDRFSKEADDISGIPAFIIGSPQVAGAGRTLGGLAMLMGNAAKGIKRNLSSIDKHIIEPVVGGYYVLNMLHDPDKQIKADAQVLARGSAGLLQRELSQARTVEVLSVLTPFIQAGFIPPEGTIKLLRDIVKGMGYDPDAVLPDITRMKELAQAVASPAAAGGDGSQPSLNNPSATPQLDGRSAPAQGALASLTPIPSPTGLPQGA